MENQINNNEQNIQPMSFPGKSKANYLMISIIVALIVFIVVGSLTIISVNKQRLKNKTVPSAIILTSPVSESTENGTICSTTNSYLSKYFNISFSCLPGYKIYESKEGINISSITNEPYTFIFITKPEVTNSYWKRDKVESLIITQIENFWSDPNPITGREKESLKRIENIMIGGVSTFSFIDKTPYEGAPLYKYVIPYKGSYLYIQVMASGFSDNASNENKKTAETLKEIALSIKFTD